MRRRIRSNCRRCPAISKSSTEPPPCSPNLAQFFVAWGFVEVLPERVTILAETALHPNEIDVNEAQQELQEGEKLWQEAGDDGEKYDEANAITRKAEEKIASAQGKST